MSAPTHEALRKTLNAVRRRRSRLYLLYHGSITLGGILVLALAISLAAAWIEPSTTGIWLLFGVFAAGVAGLGYRFVRRLRRMRSDDREMALYVEESIPDLEQRLLTSLEFSSETEAARSQGVSPQFVRQLWQDAETHMQKQQTRVQRVTSSRRPAVAASAALGVAMVTAAAFLLSESLQQAGGMTLWPFAQDETRLVESSPEPEANAPELSLSVQPGDERLRRGAAFEVVARVRNGDPGRVELSTRPDGAPQGEWTVHSMERGAAGSDEVLYRYEMPSLQEEVSYYVSLDDGEHQSRQYHVTLYDPPRVERIDVAYDYPDYTGREDEQQNDAGDMVVPEGTGVSLTVHFNKQLRTARMQFDDEADHYEDQSLELDGDTGQAEFTVEQDTAYRIAGIDRDDLEIENAGDYYIRAVADEPPSLSLRVPGGDQQVMPLEEVPVAIDASDDYGLSEFTLHYNPVGGQERTVNFLEDQGARDASGEHLLYLEQLDLEPGDFVNYYVTVADNNGLDGPQEVVSDIYFLQIVSTDEAFRDAGGGGQQGGQGGQGGGQDSALVSMQKDIIAATWNLRRQQSGMDAQDFSDDVAVVAQSQRDAVERARMSIDRLSERVEFANDAYTGAVEQLRQAIEYMDEAATQLDEEAVTSALSPEQQALQYILRSEAEINRTNVSMQRSTAGGGGGQNQREQQNLRELFEMELGENQNRYETPDQGGGRNNQSEESSRLEELAQRQEGLTRAQRNLSRRMDEMSEEQQRRELERLRREQEQLQTELDQLAQQMNNGQRGQQRAQGQSGQQSQQSQSGANGQQGLQRALEQMREATRAQSPAQAAARGQRALESLRQEQQRLEQQADSSVNQLARNLGQRGSDLAESQRQLREQLEQLSREQGLGQTRQAVREDEQVQELIRQQENQRSELSEIEEMLRALIARAGSDNDELATQAQRARRSLQPLREQMDNSSRLLDNGMISTAENVEGDVSENMSELERNLQALGGDGGQQADVNALAQSAREARELREQIEELERQARQYQQEDGQQGASVEDMRERLSRSRELSQQLSRAVDQMRRGNRSGASRADAGAAGDQQRNARSASGGIPERGEAYAWGSARSIQSEISRQSLEDFLTQPELLSELLEPAMELEETLRARAEQQEIENRLYTASDEEVPEQYRGLVEQYYRALSESGEPAESASTE